MRSDSLKSMGLSSRRIRRVSRLFSLTSFPERLELPEYVSIKEGLTAEGEEQYGITYGSPLLEKMVELACDPLPLASCRLSFHYLKSQGFDRLIQDQFSFRKSVCRVTSTAPIKTDYLVLACRYVARSDEQKEGLISLFFNFETGALIPQASNLSSNAVMEAAPLPESMRASCQMGKNPPGDSTRLQGDDL